MKDINNILIGVDLSYGDKLVSDELTSSTQEAVQLGLKIAKECDACVHFFYSLDIGAQAQRSIQEDKQAEATVVDKARQELNKLLKQAKQEGVRAESHVTFGKSWIEMIRYAIRQRCDSVVVGSKQHGALEQLFIGNTGMNLLRNCPSPVWVTHPSDPDSSGNVLVAHDLTEVGNQALEYGAAVAEYRKAPLHVIHVIEPHYVRVAEPMTIEVSVDDDAREALQDRITQQVDALGLSVESEVHVTEGSAETVVLNYIEQHDIDLLVLGTLARSGIQGLLIGNTAERLLPQTPCSVLAVKPEGFQTPIATA